MLQFEKTLDQKYLLQLAVERDGTQSAYGYVTVSFFIVYNFIRQGAAIFLLRGNNLSLHHR
jgi:hypothetical protein